MFRKATKKVDWWEPRWSYMPGLLREAHEVFSPAAIIRIIALYTALAATIICAAIILVPNLQLNWLRVILFPSIILPTLVTWFLLQNWLVPPMVRLDECGVHYSMGQTQRLYKHAQIHAVRMVFDTENRISIWVTLEKVSRRIGVSPRADLRAIARQFDGKLTICDRRREMRQGNRSAVSAHRGPECPPLADAKLSC